MEVGEPPTEKRCDQLKVPVEKEGMTVGCGRHVTLGPKLVKAQEHIDATLNCYPGLSYQYCYPGNKVEPRVLSSVVVGYIWSGRVCQETGLPGIDEGQPPAAVPVEPEPLPPVIQPFE